MRARRHGEFATEAAGLRWLAEPGALRVAEVLAVGEDWLALRWIERGRLDAVGEEELGRGLAALHRAGASVFGGERPLRLGPLELPNEPTGDWPSFYAARRLRPLAARAGLEDVVERVCERIDAVAGPPEPPSRLHGDLWSGNVLGGADGRPWLIDPAAYGGHREVDLAMLALFGTPSPRRSRRTTRSGPAPTATRTASRCTSCSRCSCTPCCSAAGTWRPRRPRRSDTPRCAPGRRSRR